MSEPQSRDYEWIKRRTDREILQDLEQQEKWATLRQQDDPQEDEYVTVKRDMLEGVLKRYADVDKQRRDLAYRLSLRENASTSAATWMLVGAALVIIGYGIVQWVR